MKKAYKKRKLFSVPACIVAFVIILSSCADRQSNNNLPLSEPQNNEMITSTPDSSLTEPDSKTEHHTPSIDNEQSNVTDGSSSNGEPSSNRPNSNTQQTKPPVESTLPGSQPSDNFTTEENTMEKMNLQIGNNSFTATLESNAAVDALVDMMHKGPVVIQMSDYSGFEKVGSLGTSLPANDEQTTTQAGDIVLYNGDQMVIFYGSNSWSYTRLGKIDDLSGWEDALGSGDITVTLSVD